LTLPEAASSNPEPIKPIITIYPIMELDEAIRSRRSYRSLAYVEVTDGMVEQLATAASLAPSCFNNQPWRYIFVREDGRLEALKGTLSSGNRWALDCSMIIAVASAPSLDCRIKEREYWQFDTGMGTGMMLLKAEELGLVVHPIAGYDTVAASELLGLSVEGGHVGDPPLTLITLLIVGKHSSEMNATLSEKQVEVERERPARRPLSEISFMERFEGA